MTTSDEQSDRQKTTMRLALEFRSDAIALLSSDSSGLWVPLQSVRLDAPDFSGEAKNLCRAARKLTGQFHPAVEILLPDAQVLSFDAPESVVRTNRLLRGRAVAAALAGRSPVSAVDLCFDHAPHADGVGVSAVERAVVDEAVTYARRWGFKPGRISTRHGHAAFPKGPAFSAVPVLPRPSVLVAGAVAASALIGLIGWAILTMGADAPDVQTADIPAVEPSAMIVEPAPLSPLVAGEEQPFVPVRVQAQTDPRIDTALSAPAGTAPPEWVKTAVGPSQAEVADVPPEAVPAAQIAVAADGAEDSLRNLVTAAALEATRTPPQDAPVLPQAFDGLTKPLTYNDIAADPPSAEPDPVVALLTPVPRPDTEGGTAPVDPPAVAEAEAIPSAEPVSEPDDEAIAVLPDKGPAAPAVNEDDIPGPGSVAAAPLPTARPDHLDMTPSTLAVAAAPRPTPRPKSIKPRASVIEAAAADGDVPDSVEVPVRRSPTGPGVANAATLKAAIRLEEMNLLGVFGSNVSRRALLRMPDGQIMRVTQGTVVDGWVVSRIDATSMRMTRGGTAQTLNVAR